MKRYLPIAVVVLLLAIVAGVVAKHKEHQRHTAVVTTTPPPPVQTIGRWVLQRSCARPPHFLAEMHIAQPVVIDLTQQHYKGVAFWYGRDFRQVLHRKQWEQYGYLSTYTLDTQGNLYLVPMPFISIEPTTFNLQKNIYKLDTNSGKLSIFMHFDDVHPSANNPYGLSAIAYDCDDGTLWVSSLAASDYQHQRGVIYHIDPRTKTVLQRLEGVDALTLKVAKSQEGKYLLVGNARESTLYAYPITQGRLGSRPIRLLTLPDATMQIRKIKLKAPDRLALQAIPFSYTLISQTATQDRTYYEATLTSRGNWQITKLK